MKEDFKKFANSKGLSSSLVESVINQQMENSLTPMILEERELRVTQLSVFDRMMMDRIIWITGGIGDEMSAVVQAQLMYMDSIGNEDITVHLNTPGGSVMAGLGIIDVMNYIKSDIATVNVGMCASMGSVLLSAGTKGKRSSLIYSKVMTHMVSHGIQGNVQDTRINQYEAEKFNYILFKMLAENCGKSFEDMFETSRNDKWFNSDEALEFGLIDNVLNVNENNKSISDMLSGFDEFYQKEVLKQ